MLPHAHRWCYLLQAPTYYLRRVGEQRRHAALLPQQLLVPQHLRLKRAKGGPLEVTRQRQRRGTQRAQQQQAGALL